MLFSGHSMEAKHARRAVARQTSAAMAAFHCCLARRCAARSSSSARSSRHTKASATATTQGPVLDNRALATEGA
jgi:hypothetical protein